MDQLDAALHWLVEHDPRRALFESDDDYARAAGIETQRSRNRARKFEVRYSEARADHPNHCAGCADKAHRFGSSIR